MSAPDLQARLDRHVAALRRCRRCPEMKPAGRFRWRDPQPRHPGRPGARRQGAGPRPALRVDRRKKTFPLVQGPQRSRRGDVPLARLHGCGLSLLSRQAPHRRGPSARAGRDRELLRLAEGGNGSASAGSRDRRRQAGDPAVHSVREARRRHRKIIFPPSSVGTASISCRYPHPSGASPWPHQMPGRVLLPQAMALIARHPAWKRTMSGDLPE